MRRSSLALLLATALAACGGASTTTEIPGTGGTAGSAGDPGGAGGSTGGNGGGTGGGNAGGGAAGQAGAGGAGGGTSGGDVRIFVEPDGKDGSELVAAINGATQSVHMTMYLLSSRDVISALLGRKAAGLEVKVVLNRNFPTSSTSNAQVFSQLQSGGVDVVWAPSAFTYTHEKCVILDGKTAWIMTMNATGSSPNANREYLAVDTNPADVAEAEAIFQADFANKSVTPSGALLVAPVNARDKLVQLVGSATRTLDIEGEEFSDYAVTNAVVAAAGRGVQVRLVVASGSTAASQQKAITSVKQAGVTVVATSTPYIHAKAMIADGATAYVGSENFSGGSLGYNRELGLIFDQPSEVAKVASAIATDFAAGAPQ